MTRTLLVVFLTLSAVKLPAQISPGPLSRSHAALEGVTMCTKCHSGANAVGSQQCLACHTEIASAQRLKRGLHAINAGTSCETCHKEHLGLDGVTTRFSAATFDHASTGFALKGKHERLACNRCHTAALVRRSELRPKSLTAGRVSYLGLQPDCNACHEDKHGGTLSVECGTCHTSDRWAPAVTFNHAAAKFSLTGKHTAVQCAACHRQFADRTRALTFAVSAFGDCTPCHTSPHRAGFSKKPCSACHVADGWKTAAGFDHSDTRFPLSGRHTSVPCERCHTGKTSGSDPKANRFAAKPFSDCTPCHASPHRTGFAARTCASCHATDSWSTIDEAAFDHRLTAFPLRGKHTTVKCRQCHERSGPTASYRTAFTDRPHTCYPCHADVHRGRFARSYANDCARCHVEEGFRPSTFALSMHEHTGFPLAGSHAAVLCDRCHRPDGASVFRLSFSSTRCQDCHEDRHKGEFAVQMKEKSCAACHSMTEWSIRSFDHSTTSFVLVGRHASTPCAKCHVEKGPDGRERTRYSGTPRTCFECHADVHMRQFAVNDITDCSPCHTPAGWKRLLLSHETGSRFSLSGAHARTPCRGCHNEERSAAGVFIRYKPLGTACESCHKGGK